MDRMKLGAFGEQKACEMLLMDGLPDAVFSRFLDELRRLHVPVALKAVATEHNVDWSSLRLHRELEREHLLMGRMKGGGPPKKNRHKKKR